MLPTGQVRSRDLPRFPSDPSFSAFYFQIRQRQIQPGGDTYPELPALPLDSSHCPPLQHPSMQFTIPDCCLGEICPGLHVEGHNKKEDVSPLRSRAAPGT